MFKSLIHSLFKTNTPALIASLLILLQICSVNALESTLPNGDNLTLFGIGVHQEQRNDIYVGALFTTENISDSSQLLSQAINKRMSLKFISKYSSRKMSRLWKQRIAMNNPKGNWQPLTKEIVQFARIFKRGMEAGDELNIDFDQSVGTLVYLNRTLFLTIKNFDFYELLLNVWIGNIPPTKAFKTGITGKNTLAFNQQLIAQYENIQPELGKFDADKVTPTAPLVTKIASISTSLPKKKTPPNITNSKKIKPKRKTVSSQIETTAQQNATSNIRSNLDIEADDPTENLLADLPITRTKIEKINPQLVLGDSFQINLGIRKKSPSIEVDEPNTGKDVTQKLADTNNRPSDNPLNDNPSNDNPSNDNILEKVAKLDLADEPLFDSDLYVGAYTRELINAIKRIQSYPKKALARSIEGDITLKITIDREGEIISNKLIQRSGSRVLDRGVMKMVRKAQPFPQIPVELNMNEFEFEVPLSFTLSN